MGSVNQREVMGNALTFVHWSLIPHGCLPLPTLTRDGSTTLHPKAISILVRAFLKACVAIWHESVASALFQAKGIALGRCGGMLVHACVCVLCIGIFLWVWDGVATLSLDGWAGSASFSRLGRWLCHGTCLLSERLLQRRDLIIVSESEASCTLLLATSGCLSYVSHGNTAQQPRRRCQEEPTV